MIKTLQNHNLEYAELWLRRSSNTNLTEKCRIKVCWWLSEVEAYPLNCNKGFDKWLVSKVELLSHQSLIKFLYGKISIAKSL